MVKPRNYKEEYARFHSKPEEIKKRAERNSARATMKKKLGSKAIAGKDIDHVKPLRKGGSNAAGNLRVSSVRANRNWELEE